jgi:hypothetical protein
LELSPIDFGIVCCRRLLDDQQTLVNAGRSQTLYSLHLIGHAIDFAPYWSGHYRDAWPFYYPIADAFKRSSQELVIPIRWGGAWGVDLGRFRSAQDAQTEYIMTRSDSVFFDGPHIELCRETYPPDFSAIPELVQAV